MIQFNLKNNKIILSNDGKVTTFSDYKGLRLIAELMKHPNAEIPCISLYTENVEKMMAGFSEIDIDYNEYPLADARYINECKKELGLLKNQLIIAERNNNRRECEDIIEQFERLCDFMTAVYNPYTNRIKNFPDQYSKCLVSLKKAVTRALKLIAKQDPQVAEILRKRLRIDYYCCYRL